ncbi:acetate uptake transporter [Pseudarthrobacter raffinosi]|uniref:acetate uptake transporter n=1 Tax=Pseudarthrobacter raffinosi TaxID=2953651 RepID=UPI00208F5D40|nr:MULTISPECIES: acetate uptake transporter [unclassified Pseudarthrobacter]MCO4239791.1 acetate uptake transporter [Pseudarthrobacter sp. MDT3-28]MCO4265011.1 acetate uptake transporter [Pseudarthrobacter sp. MDT3-26]
MNNTATAEPGPAAHRTLAPADPTAHPVPAATGAAVFADPAALGLGAFALTTFVLSTINAGLLPATVEPVVLGLALFYGGIAQFSAGIWEFAKGNTFGATAFCSYGAFWMAFWFLVRFTDLSAAGKDAGKGVGVFLLAWGIFTLYMTVAARRTNRAVFLVFIALTPTFFALAIGAYTGAVTITRIGGWLGLLTALLAWYASFAVVTNSTHQRTVLPINPR